MFRKKRSALERSLIGAGVDLSMPLGKTILEMMIDNELSNYLLIVKTDKDWSGFEYDFHAGAFEDWVGNVMQDFDGECMVYIKGINSEWSEEIIIYSEHTLFGRPLDNV